MENYKSLAHSRYDCKYHIVFVPKFRKKTLYGRIRQYLKGVFHELAKQKGCEIVSGHMAGDHMCTCVSQSAEVCSWK
jgi:putative transposase